jgi:hypothetical protein
MKANSRKIDVHFPLLKLLTCMHMCVHVFVYVLVCVCVCVCTLVSMQKERL